jgi:hypothetical protein
MQYEERELKKYFFFMWKCFYEITRRKLSSAEVKLPKNYWEKRYLWQNIFTAQYVLGVNV